MNKIIGYGLGYLIKNKLNSFRYYLFALKIGNYYVPNYFYN